MKIEVTREIIERTKDNNWSDIYNCICATAITETTGRPCSIGVREGCFKDGEGEIFSIDEMGQAYIRRYVASDVHKQLEGFFEISWNPKPKNWQYRLQDTNQEAPCALIDNGSKHSDQVLASR